MDLTCMRCHHDWTVHFGHPTITPLSNLIHALSTLRCRQCNADKDYVYLQRTKPGFPKIMETTEPLSVSPGLIVHMGADGSHGDMQMRCGIQASVAWKQNMHISDGVFDADTFPGHVRIKYTFEEPKVTCPDCKR